MYPAPSRRSREARYRTLSAENLYALRRRRSQTRPGIPQSRRPRSGYVVAPAGMAARAGGTGHLPSGPSLTERLKERKLVQWMLVYFFLAGVVLQIIDGLAGVWAWPLALQRGITLIAGMAFFPALTIAWYHGEKGHQRVCCTEVGLIALSIVCTVAGLMVFCY